MFATLAAVCDVCSGNGWVTTDENHVRACDCQKETRKLQRIARAAIPKRYAHCTLADFYDRGNPSLVRVKRRVLEFIDCWPAIDRGLLLMGGCGSGKTHLAVAMLQEIILGGKPGEMHFSNFQDLIQEIQASFGSDDSPTKSQILQPLLDAELLVLDELGSQKPTMFVQDVLYYVINSRYNDEKVTIFTTNYVDDPKIPTEERLSERIGERLRSRIYEMAETLLVESDDYRKNVKSRRF